VTHFPRRVLGIVGMSGGDQGSSSHQSQIIPSFNASIAPSGCTAACIEREGSLGTQPCNWHAISLSNYMCVPLASNLDHPIFQCQHCSERMYRGLYRKGRVARHITVQLVRDQPVELYVRATSIESRSSHLPMLIPWSTEVYGQAFTIPEAFLITSRGQIAR